jgi:hypothetical protein
MRSCQLRGALHCDRLRSHCKSGGSKIALFVWLLLLLCNPWAWSHTKIINRWPSRISQAHVGFLSDYQVQGSEQALIDSKKGCLLSDSRIVWIPVSGRGAWQSAGSCGKHASRMPHVPYKDGMRVVYSEYLDTAGRNTQTNKEP